MSDQPHPAALTDIILRTVNGDPFGEIALKMKELVDMGYSPLDLITTMFRVVKYLSNDLDEITQLNLMRCVGRCHMSILSDGGSLLMLVGMLADFRK